MLVEILISLGIGFIIALIVTGIMKSKLKSVHMQSAASEYIESGSFKLNGQNDFFLYKTTEVQPKPQQDEQNK